MKTPCLCLALFALACLVPAQAEHEGKVQIVLVGDSTTEGSVPRQLRPQGPHLEEVIRLLLAAEKDLPPTNVINTGLSGEFIRRLIDSGRYDQVIKPIVGADYFLIRYGLNDRGRRENFAENFPKDYHELITKLKTDFPAATIIVTTVIPYFGPVESTEVNDLNRKVAEAEGVKLFDIYPRYAKELELQGPNMLNYRRFPVAKVPEMYQELVKGSVQNGSVVVMDNQFDAHLGSLPGWYGDRHPNLAGYNVIGDETAKYMAKLLRERKPAAAPAP